MKLISAIGSYSQFQTMPKWPTFFLTRPGIKLNYCLVKLNDFHLAKRRDLFETDIYGISIYTI